MDSTTGQVKASKRVEGNSASTRARVGVRRSGVGADVGGFQNENLAEAVALAIEDAVDFIISELDSVPWTADVVAVRGDQVYINRGERAAASGSLIVGIAHPWKRGTSPHEHTGDP